MTEKLPDEVQAVLLPDESPLWVMRKRSYMDYRKCTYLLMLLIVPAVLVLFIAAAREHVLSSVGGLITLVLLGCILMSLVQWRSRNRRDAATLYVLTNQRALVVELPVKGSKLTVYAKAVSPLLLEKVVHRRNGVVDYVLAVEKVGSMSVPFGFMRVAAADDPGALMQQLGVVFPRPKEKRASQTLSRPGGSGWRALGFSVGMLIFLWLCGIVSVDSGADLFVRGESAEAVVLDNVSRMEKKGRRSRRVVNVHYPVVCFRAADGAEHVGLSLSGREKLAFSRGAGVEVLYDTANPKRVTLRDSGILLTPGLLLLGAFWCGWSAIGKWREWRKQRAADFLLIELVPGEELA